MKFIKYMKDRGKCVNCKVCSTIVSCLSPERCIGCGARYLAYPYEAINPVPDYEERSLIEIIVDGQKYEVPK